ncbi:hypothetical protein FCULG_00004508 [Fusarium culmorum]|uniref:Hydrophobin 1 n=1 Tax=Fusarium culmorum TaxID=5516 RepID=A0A2T4HC95_FUSCU|nr:hypothetical protein FCULG_00004508 [Fusarium culmorum]
MKFLLVTFLALATGAFAVPGGGPRPPPPPPKPISCGNDQSLYCCTNDGGNNVNCASFSNGGIGGICNGMQVCCNNNQGTQGCNVGNGGGTITFTQNFPGGHWRF